MLIGWGSHWFSRWNGIDLHGRNFSPQPGGRRAAVKWGGKPYILDGQGCIRLQLLREGQLFRALQDTVSAVRDNLSCPEAGSGPGGGRLDAVHVIAALLDDMEENREWPLQCCLPGKTGHILLFAGCTGGSLRRRWEIARGWGRVGVLRHAAC